jgi:YidC/Oxa1 family membrane protein insertase
MSNTILDYIRFTLYALLIFVAFLLYQDWMKEHPTTPTVTTLSSPSSNENGRLASLPTPLPTNAAEAAQNPTQAAAATIQTSSDATSLPTSQLVQVKTDVLDVTIDTRGGDIIDTKLLHYPVNLGSAQPIQLLNDDAKTRYLAESGLLSTVGPDTKQAQALYQTAETHYQLNTNGEDIIVPLTWQHDGLKVTKNFIFKRGSYEIQVQYNIENESNTAWQGNLYTQLLRTNVPPEAQHSGFMNLTTYFGAALSTPDKRFQKITFKDMQENNLNQTAQDGWAAMMQHYFISAWIPNVNTTSTYYTRVMPNNLFAIGMIGQTIAVPAHADANVAAKLYVGPTIADYLEKAAPSLKLTIDYGWFWFISGIIFWMMQKIYDVVGNWGWAIVIVTIIIKLLFYQLSAKSYRSMSGLKALQPRIELLKERYKDDKQKLTQATLELYRQEKVNPMSGCLPIIIQIPVFIALYWVLVESVQLRQAPFILWIHDLSKADPYYVLPVLMGISMFLQQRLNPPPPDPTQAKVMMFMPFIFIALFANFPAGLMLYWFVNNTLSFLQQWYVMRKITAKK